MTTRAGKNIVCLGWAWVLCVLVSSCPFCLHAAETQVPAVLSDAEQAWVKDHPVVTWAVDPAWPPFSSIDNRGRAAGIDVDIVRLIETRVPLRFQFVPTTNWSETFDLTAAGKIDFIAGIARTIERMEVNKLLFTENYCNFPTVIVTRKDMPFFTSVHELTLMRVALPKSYATVEKLLEINPIANLILTENEEQAMVLVASRKADVTALNLASATYVVHMRGLTNLKISGFTELDFFLGFATRPGAEELRSILQKSLASITPREKEEVYSAYIVPETRSAIHWKTWRRRAIYALVLGGAVCLLVLLWNRLLAREIRMRKRAEAGLVQARDTIKSHAIALEGQARELKGLNDKLTWANKDLEAFSSSVSHDLKAPVRRLRSFADLIESRAGERLDSTAREFLHQIQSESDRMFSLITTLLGFARTGLAEAHLASVDMGGLVKEVIAEMKGEIEHREIQWVIGPLPQVQCDPVLMKQVYANLLGNAIKFTRGRSPARIEAGVLPKKADENQLVFFVRDDGVGFPPQKAENLFAGFQRLHSAQEYEGSGIGLLNVKRIIQKHGGRVWAEGSDNKGATFYFSLPEKPLTKDRARGGSEAPPTKSAQVGAR